ncbi:GNAT family N-acetyltransferase [Loktanella agnita]|uniref:GNAT family N-acetyltransferase n=1 Tax=Loktanella agnita TaxID=287097 RepID=UPI0039890565
MTQSSFLVRPATISDAGTIASINVTSWQETYVGLMPSEVISRVTQEGRSRMWTDILNSAEVTGSLAVFVAELDDEAVGYVSVGNQRDKGLLERGFSSEITAIYVLEAAQRLGIGRALLRHGFHHLTKFDHTASSLWVLDSNRKARGFYKASGGEKVSEREEVRSDTTLREVAYGWYKLSSLSA